MEDGVKFIFKTLIKVPVIIAITYLIFNIFSFTVAYFRLYSVAQMVNSIVMENNYIPGTPTDDAASGTLYGQINDYIKNNVSTTLLQDVRVVVDTEPTDGITSDNTRVQYGKTANVSVSGRFVWLLPLVNIQGEYLTDGVGGIGGAQGTGATVANPEAILAERGFGDGTGYNEAAIGDHGAQSQIRFEYSVPCMKYYSDLLD